MFINFSLQLLLFPQLINRVSFKQEAKQQHDVQKRHKKLIDEPNQTARHWLFTNLFFLSVLKSCPLLNFIPFFPPFQFISIFQEN